MDAAFLARSDRDLSKTRLLGWIAPCSSPKFLPQVVDLLTN